MPKGRNEPIGTPDIAPGEVHVWFDRLDVPEARLEPMAASLSDDERERAGRFRFERHRRRWTAARVFLRQVLAGYVGCTPYELTFAEAAGGKPVLPGDAPIRFNLSHSADMALVAVALDREVGVDVERVRPLRDADALARRVLSESEREVLSSAPGPARLRLFLEAWTRKEAVLKASGEGLRRELRHLDLLGGTERAAAVGSQTFLVRTLEPSPEYIAAVAAERDDWTLELFSRDGVAGSP